MYKCETCDKEVKSKRGLTQHIQQAHISPVKKVEFEMTAVIPVAQYANVQPVIKGYGETYDQAKDDATKKMQELWQIFAENKDALQVAKTVADAPAVAMEKMKCFFSGNEVDFDPVAHKYYVNGERLMSGSGYAHQFEHEFNKAMILPRYAEKVGATEEEVDAYWTSKADCSTTFGTALHQAMEHYGKWHNLNQRDIDDKTGEPKPIGIPATLLPIVEAYFKGREGVDAEYEPFVASIEKLRCGQIDQLEIVDRAKKICIIRDFKTNADLEKMGIPKTLKAPFSFLTNTPLSKYALQLGFYKSIAEDNGWTVQATVVDWWNGVDEQWEELELKTYPVDQPEKIDFSKMEV